MSILIASHYRKAVPCLNFQIKMREQIKRQSLVFDYREVLITEVSNQRID
jgi:hypothetical protein